MNNSSEPQQWRNDLERLRALEYIPKTHIDFFEYIFHAHYQAKGRLATDKIYPPISQDKMQETLTQGIPLIRFNQMNIKAEPLREHFMQLSTILKKYGESDPAHIESVIGPESCNCLDLKELINKTIFHDSDYLLRVSGQAGIDSNTLEFIALTLARPLFELAASDTKDILAEYPWWRNYCPACGGIPFMTRIRRDDGMRVLRCSLCAVEWKFDRVKCPFCNNEDQKRMKFFFYHESSPYRLYVCDCCKRYIKCVDERKMDQTRTIDLAIEDIATLFFDVLAREKGYLPPSILMDTIGQELTPCPEKHNHLN